MLQTRPPQKRYWLRGALIAVVVQGGLLVFAHFYLPIVFGCGFNPRHCPSWKNPWLDAIVGIYLVPFFLLSALLDVLEISEPLTLTIDIGLYLAYLAAAFGVGARIGTRYGRKRARTAIEDSQVLQRLRGGV